MDLSPEELVDYRNALKSQVCSACHATGYEDVCQIGHSGECPIDHFLPQIVQAVLSTPRQKDVSAYVPGLRQLVCEICENQDEKGVCKHRNLARCGLDSFLILVVESVEEVYDRRHLAGMPTSRQVVKNNS